MRFGFKIWHQLQHLQLRITTQGLMSLFSLPLYTKQLGVIKLPKASVNKIYKMNDRISKLGSLSYV